MRSEASKEKKRVYAAAHREQHRLSCRKYDATHKEQKHEYYQAHKERHLETTGEYAKTHREQHREANKKHYAANPAAYAAKTRKRQASKIQRTPVWADLEKIKELYVYARVLTETFGVPYHVDHILPLQGKYVSGLHVHNNLQILPGEENVKKGNRFIPS